jgi:hypothetical protein
MSFFFILFASRNTLIYDQNTGNNILDMSHHCLLYLYRVWYPAFNSSKIETVILKEEIGAEGFDK